MNSAKPGMEIRAYGIKPRPGLETLSRLKAGQRRPTSEMTVKELRAELDQIEREQLRADILERPCHPRWADTRSGGASASAGPFLKTKSELFHLLSYRILEHSHSVMFLLPATGIIVLPQLLRANLRA